jgi:cell division topological specificity factor
MSWLGLLRRGRSPSSAQTAKDRLQNILSHERQERTLPDYLPLLQRDILGAVSQYFEVASDQVHIRLRRTERRSTMEIEIELPTSRAMTMNPGVGVPRSAFAR